MCSLLIVGWCCIGVVSTVLKADIKSLYCKSVNALSEINEARNVSFCEHPRLILMAAVIFVKSPSWIPVHDEIPNRFSMQYWSIFRRIQILAGLFYISLLSKLKRRVKCVILAVPLKLTQKANDFVWIQWNIKLLRTVYIKYIGFFSTRHVNPVIRLDLKIRAPDSPRSNVRREN